MRSESAQQKYLNELFGLSADGELAAIRASLLEHEVEGMSISGFEARLLQFFIRACGVRTVVEVGTLFGFSGLAMAKALPSDGRLWTLEKSDKHFEIARANFARYAAGAKVTALHGDAPALLEGLVAEGPFDMCFIDADKAAYPKYLDWAEANVRPGGFIVGDNTFLWGGVYDQATRPRGDESVRAMKAFNARLADTSRYNSTLIPTVEGLTFAQKLF